MSGNYAMEAEIRRAEEDTSPGVPLRDERRAYRVVDMFEAELCDYTGAPYAVAVNSCTNALFLALKWERPRSPMGYPIKLPRRTYIGVLQSVLNASYTVEWSDEDDWQEQGFYWLPPTRACDSARWIRRLSYVDGIECLSFHSAKQLPLGRGGAILTDDEEAARWFRAARTDGRYPGDGGRPVFPAWHCPMPPDVAARGLDVLSRWNDAGWSPPALSHTDYPDLSAWWPG